MSKHGVLREKQGVQGIFKDAVLTETYVHLTGKSGCIDSKAWQTQPPCLCACSSANDAAQAGGSDANLPAQACHLKHFSRNMAMKKMPN